LYLIVDIGEEGANAKPEGILRLVREAKCEDIPRSIIGDHLILNVIRVICLSLHLCVHQLIIIAKGKNQAGAITPRKSK
jgi:hypothetical protein